MTESLSFIRVRERENPRIRCWELSSKSRSTIPATSPSAANNQSTVFQTTKLKTQSHPRIDEQKTLYCEPVVFQTFSPKGASTLFQTTKESGAADYPARRNG